MLRQDLWRNACTSTQRSFWHVFREAEDEEPSMPLAEMMYRNEVFPPILTSVEDDGCP